MTKTILSTILILLPFVARTVLGQNLYVYFEEIGGDVKVTQKGSLTDTSTHKKVYSNVEMTLETSLLKMYTGGAFSMNGYLKNAAVDIYCCPPADTTWKTGCNTKTEVSASFSMDDTFALGYTGSGIGFMPAGYPNSYPPGTYIDREAWLVGYSFEFLGLVNGESCHMEWVGADGVTNRIGIVVGSSPPGSPTAPNAPIGTTPPSSSPTPEPDCGLFSLSCIANFVQGVIAWFFGLFTF